MKKMIFLLAIKIFPGMLSPVNTIYKIHIFFLLPITLSKSNDNKIYTGDLKKIRSYAYCKITDCFLLIALLVKNYIHFFHGFFNFKLHLISFDPIRYFMLIVLS